VFAWQDGHYMVSWFELPVSDIDRAKAFYEKVFAIKLSSMDFGYVKIAAFPDPGNATGASGSLMQNPNNQPTGQGTVVYFTVE
jgi:predicted enzyme related to lactoylglutathione lyase